MCRGLGFAVFIVGCSASPEHKLPTATNTPHLDQQPTSVACGDDVALYGNTSPDVRYAYTYDSGGRISQITGAYAGGGPDNTIAYSWSGDNFTHMLELHGWGDAQSEITANYDAANHMTDYTWAYNQTDYSDTWAYAFTNYVGDNPAQEIITDVGAGTPAYSYQLAYDGFGRLATATGDDPTDVTTWTYDDQALTITADWGNGQYTDVISYDDQDLEQSELWGGSDPTTIVGSQVFAWSGDQLTTATYSSGTTDAPKQPELVQVDTLRYNCAMARTNAGRTMRLPKSPVRRAK